MAETVSICKDNINISLEKINTINLNINEEEEVRSILERRILNSEFDLYLKTMDRAINLAKYFENDLVYFKDSFNIASRLVKTDFS
jgi:hypothetical protein